jgi:subtilisin family serine protease
MLQFAAVEKSSGLTPHVIQINASQVWQQGYTGKNVVVAILDSGINDEHTDLKDHLWQGYADTDGDGEADDIIHGWNFTTKDGNGDADIQDEYGHGTHCAGIICGDGTSGNITGIAPDATLMTLKTINRTGSGSPANMINAVQFAIENGADILSISSGFK